MSSTSTTESTGKEDNEILPYAAIYLVLNNRNEKKYVGQTKQNPPHNRWRPECYPNPKETYHFANAMRKVKKDIPDVKFNRVSDTEAEFGYFSFKVIKQWRDEITQQDLDLEEIHGIKIFNSLSYNDRGYNTKTGGHASFSHDEETKERISTTKRQNNATKRQKTIDERGYFGHIKEVGGAYQAYNSLPGMRSWLGTYATHEEAEEALCKYTRDPRNFVPELSDRKHGTGSVTLCTHRSCWMARVQQNKERKHLGFYDTEEEAENACDRYLKDPHSFVMPPTLKRRDGTGSVWKSKNGKRWVASYGGKYLGTFDTEAQADAAILAHKTKESLIKP